MMPGCPVIQLHNLSPDECKNYAKKIKELKGVYVNSQNFQRKVSHLVCGKLSCSENFLAACVSGCWVLSLAFIDYSHMVGHWLKEDDFQFSVYDNQPPELLSAYNRWHWRVGMSSEFAFSGWQISLLLCPENLQQLRRVMIFGGAKIIPMQLPLKASKSVPDVTYVFMDPSSHHLAPQLCDVGLLCISHEYVMDYIIKEMEPEVFDYVITSETLQRTNNFSSASSDLVEGSRSQTMVGTSWAEECDDPESSAVTFQSSGEGSAEHDDREEKPVVVSVKDSDSETLRGLANCTLANGLNRCDDVIEGVLVKNKGRTPISNMDPNVPMVLPRQSVRGQKRNFIEEPEVEGQKGKGLKRLKVTDGTSSVIECSTILDCVSGSDKTTVGVQLVASLGSSELESRSPGNALTTETEKKFDSVEETSVDTQVSSSQASRDKDTRRSEKKSSKTKLIQGQQTLQRFGFFKDTSADSPDKSVSSFLRESPVGLKSEAKEMIDSARVPSTSTNSRKQLNPSHPSPSSLQQCQLVSKNCGTKSCSTNNPDADAETLPKSSASGCRRSLFDLQPKRVKAEPIDDDIIILTDDADKRVKAEPIDDDIILTDDADKRVKAEPIDDDIILTDDADKRVKAEPIDDGGAKQNVGSTVKRFLLDSFRSSSQSENAETYLSENKLICGTVNCEVKDVNGQTESIAECSKQFEQTSKGVLLRLEKLVDSSSIPPAVELGLGYCSEMENVTNESEHLPERHSSSSHIETPTSASGAGRVDLHPVSYPLMTGCRVSSAGLMPVPILVEQCLEAVREMDYEDIALLHSQPCPTRLPTPGLLREIVCLACSKELHISTWACFNLKTWLDFHKPVTPDLVQTYAEAFDLSSTESVLLRVLKHLSTHTDDKLESLISVLEYIVSVFEINFNNFLLSENPREPQSCLVVRAFWEHSCAVCYNGRVKELVLALRNALKAPAFCCRSHRALLSLAGLVARCLHMASARWQTKSPTHLSNHDLLVLARELSRLMKDTCAGRDPSDLPSLLSCLNPPWFRVLVLATILSAYNDYLLAESIRIDKISLRAILLQYFFLLPPLHEVDRSHKSQHVYRSEGNSSYLSQRMSHEGARSSESSSVDRYVEVSPSKSSQGSPLKTFLRSAGAFKEGKVNKRNGKGESAVHLAAIKNNQERLSLLLQVPGVDVNLRDNAGWTPLHEACHHGRHACVEVLLKYVPPAHGTIDPSSKVQDAVTNKVDLNARGVEGRTPLHVAVLKDSLDVCKLLLHYGGPRLLQIKDDWGLKPIQLAKSKEMCDLLSNGAEVTLAKWNTSLSQQGISTVDQKTLELPVDWTPPQFLYDEVLGPDASRLVGKTEYSAFLSLVSLLLTAYAEWKGPFDCHRYLGPSDGEDLEILRRMGDRLKNFLLHVHKTTTERDFLALETDLLLICTLGLTLLNVKI
ncbi:uncharacterized protein LOC101844973 isoform X3 [Aplysia californica]|nr:uncharacterized protein LOC101844973 isoform X3 [Aplysia californica]XP_005091441.1 uncharacterized protein LOC101844973 isoform X3 [Aplysia californica]